jgi:hypothetical protein
LLATVRLRALSTSTAAIDVIGGVGPLRQSRETEFRINPSQNRSIASTSIAYVARVELPIALATHFGIGPHAALYFLRRDDLTASALNLGRTQSSTRAAFGAAGVFGW